MSWNEPDKNSWSNKNNQKNNDTPPDLDEIFRRIQAWFRASFGGKGPQRPHSVGTGPTRPTHAGKWSVGTLLALIGGVYVISGIYLVQPAELAVITRFGKYYDTVGSGPHWLARFIDTRKIVNVESAHTVRQGGPMLTKDENIINVEVAVQYRILDPKAYLFNVENPENSLQQATDSALRYVVGHATLDEALTWGRSEIAAAVRKQVGEILNEYQAGLTIIEVAMQPATPPEEVKSAFDDVIRAQEDEQRFINEADAYTRQIEPIAEGNAQRMLEEAKAYRSQIILRAKGDTERFLALVPEYKKAPVVTRDRLYLATMQEVLSKNPKVVMDTDASGLVYLPMDQLLRTLPSPSVEESNNMTPSVTPSLNATAASTATATPRGQHEHRRSGGAS